PDDPSSRNSTIIASLVGQLVNMRFERQDEIEADRLGVQVMSQAGYDSRAMIDVMGVLKAASKSRAPEFFSTHPNPENRLERIKKAIDELYPHGVPNGLTP